MTLAAKQTPGIRIMTLHPDTRWPEVWQNLHAVWTTEDIKSVWLTVIHDVVPTQERLAKISLSDTNLCTLCGRMDTLLHRLTDCSEGVDIWLWTRERIANILRTDPKYVLPEWTLHPYFQFWPPQKHGAILWIFAHMVHYLMQHRGRLTLADYADFLRRTRWKIYHKSRRRDHVGNYLAILWFRTTLMLGDRDSTMLPSACA
jgi:hypothetical protein